MTPSRQQRRATERQAQQAYEKHGLSPKGGMMPLVVHTRALIALLSQASDPARASAAAAASLASFERSASSHKPEITLQCQRGCAFCCHDIVGATAPEVFRLARQVLGDTAPLAAARARIEAAHRATAGARPEERLRHRRPCAMLADAACTGYAARPLACRSANSGSARACEDAFHGGGGGIPSATIPFVLRDAHLLCLLAALKGVGLDSRAYELNHALWLAVSLADAEARWLAGEDVFAGVQTTPPPGARQAALIAALLSRQSVETIGHR